MSWRFSIGELMALTGVVALNLAVVAASDRVPDLIIAIYLCGPILVGVQLALYRSAFGRRTCRRFWLGFAAAGALAATALLVAYWYMPTQRALLHAYAAFWDGIDRIAPGLGRLVSSRDGLRNAAFGLYFFVPQALLAFAGGVLTDWLARFVGRIGRGHRLHGPAA